MYCKVPPGNYLSEMGYAMVQLRFKGPGLGGWSSGIEKRLIAWFGPQTAQL